MKTHLFKVHSECKNTKRVIFFKFKKAFLRKAFFFVLASLFVNQTYALKVAIFDTGFCPHLLDKDKRVEIAQVRDVTQSVTYKCTKEKLKNRQFHGQWVLSELLKTKWKTSEGEKVQIFPFIIFNNEGFQKIRYWRRAIEEAHKKGVDLIIAAAGFPVEVSKEKEAAAKIFLRETPFLLAAGRHSPGISRNTILFPHDFLKEEDRLIFGTYFKGVDSQGPHFKDLELLEPKKINYFLPFNYKPREFAELKGTSLAVALGGRYLFETCDFQKKFSFPSCIELLSKKALKIKVKEKDTVSEVMTLALP
jgi:hypothetical protein